MAIEHGIKPNNEFDDDGRLRRTGTVWSCVAHIITAVIGSGVLSLAWSVAQLGWIAGPLCMLSFAIITYVSSSILADCYRSPDSVKGTRNYSYMDAVQVNLGKTRMWMCGLLQYLSMYVTAVAYVITTATSIRAILKSDCYHIEGHGAPCQYSTNLYMLVFGGVQIIMSQIPNVHDMVWLSVVAALMSFSYSTIGFGLGFAKVIAHKRIMGSISGVPGPTVAKKVWTSFEAVGDIAFAYPYSLILLEIQDTLRSSPAENKTMKRGSMIAIFITTFFYYCCACFGYAAFGNDTPGNLLTGFGFFEPYWLINFANACVIVHLVGGYQLYSQPIFSAIERSLTRKYPENNFLNGFCTLRFPLLPAIRINLFRLCYRTVYVMTTAGIAIAFPYFNSVLGLLGAINFWPLAIYFPVEMYFVQSKIAPWTRKWVVLRIFSFFCFLVTVISFMGSFVGLISARFG